MFRSWHCLKFEYDETEAHSFLAQDLLVRCDGSDEHKRVLAIAWILVAVSQARTTVALTPVESA